MENPLKGRVPTDVERHESEQMPCVFANNFTAYLSNGIFKIVFFDQMTSESPPVARVALAMPVFNAISLHQVLARLLSEAAGSPPDGKVN